MLSRYSDLQDEEQAANYRSLISAVDEPLKLAVEEYIRNNNDATAEQIAAYTAKVMDNLIEQTGAVNPYDQRTKNRVVDFPSVAGG